MRSNKSFERPPDGPVTPLAEQPACQSLGAAQLNRKSALLEIHVKWPDDADGDVFRRLESHGFNFRVAHDIDFNVDFSSWPPPPVAVEQLAKHYPNLTIHEPSEGGAGYLLFKLHDLASYEFVMRVQSEVSAQMLPFGGRCDSWGILHD